MMFRGVDFSPQPLGVDIQVDHDTNKRLITARIWSQRSWGGMRWSEVHKIEATSPDWERLHSSISYTFKEAYERYIIWARGLQGSRMGRHL